MPRSKPPRRKRPRHLRSHDRGMVDFFDRLERITDRAEREAEALADRAPPEELAAVRATCAENRRIFAEARAEPVTFDNPLLGTRFTQTVYLARTGQ